MDKQVAAKPFHRILLTGAAGGLGKILREKLKDWTDILRVSDLADLGAAQEGEEVVQCDLADKVAVMDLVKDVELILHFGGISVEACFEDIMRANIQGTYNIYEAAHHHKVRRVIFASSNHTIGFYKTTDFIDATMPPRPDGIYGVSKCFGESLSRYYYDRVGIETVCVRIGSAFPAPANRRMLTTYLSYDDLVELLRCAAFTPRVGYTIVFGVSDNREKWWSNHAASHLGYEPKDSSDKFAHLFPDTGRYPDADDVGSTYQGGGFILSGPQYKP